MENHLNTRHSLSESGSSPWLKAERGSLHGQTLRIKDGLLDRFDSSIPAYCYARQLISVGVLPVAFFCTNDQWARGVFSAALEAELGVLDDLAVMGLENEVLGQYAPYCLTTVTKALAQECEKVVELVMELILGRTPSRQQFIYPCEFTIRHSCGLAVPGLNSDATPGHYKNSSEGRGTANVASGHTSL